MKSPRNRPPLTLTEIEADPIEAGAPEIESPALDITVAPVEPATRYRARRNSPRQMLAEAKAEAVARPAMDAETDVAPTVEPAREAPEARLPAASEERAVAEPATVPTPRSVSSTPASRPGFVLAAVAALLWIGGIGAWAAYQIGLNRGAVDPLDLALYVLVALAPSALLFALAQALRRGAALADETRMARELSQALVAPTALAARDAGAVLGSLRADIEQTALTADRARGDLVALREALAMESRQLNEAAEQAQRVARKLADQLAAERAELSTLSTALEGQADTVVQAVDRQSRMVGEASDLAQAQLREAEAALAARAADLAVAAGEAQDAARLAADDLARQTLRLETAGGGVADQIRAVEENLAQQRAQLVTTSVELRTDQEDFSAQIESQRAPIGEHLAQTRVAAADLCDASAQGAEALKALVEAASDQFRALADLSGQEANAFDVRTREALDRFEAVAGDARDGLAEDTLRALETLKTAADAARADAGAAVEDAQAKADRLAEAIFAAGQRAESAAQARIAEAQRLVEETADLVEAAGARAVSALDGHLAQVRTALADVEASLAEIDERAGRLPSEAKARLDEIREAVEAGMETLAAATRRTAEETQAADADFQARVRRNYDMLNEAVRLMGVVGSGGRPAPTPAPRAEPTAEPSADAERVGLRGRLQLTPTARDDEFREVFEAAAGPKLTEAARGRGWRDLLAGDRDDEAGVRPESDPALSDRVIQAVQTLGVDPNALLPRARIEEAARAWHAGDGDRAREIVRRVAPAALRRISRRVLSDRDLRADTERYIRQYEALVQRSADGDPDGYAGMQLLASEAGRTFLLIDAAVGDV